MTNSPKFSRDTNNNIVIERESYGGQIRRVVVEPGTRWVSTAISSIVLYVTTIDHEGYVWVTPWKGGSTYKMHPSFFDRDYVPFGVAA